MRMKAQYTDRKGLTHCVKHETLPLDAEERRQIIDALIAVLKFDTQKQPSV